LTLLALGFHCPEPNCPLSQLTTRVSTPFTSSALVVQAVSKFTPVLSPGTMVPRGAVMVFAGREGASGAVMLSEELQAAAESRTTEARKIRASFIGGLVAGE